MFWTIFFILCVLAFVWALIADGPWLSGKKKEKMDESIIGKYIVPIIGGTFFVLFIFWTLYEAFFK